jgi:hypothetical protein
MMSFRLGSAVANAAAYGAVWAGLALALGVAINMVVAHRPLSFAISHALLSSVAVGVVLAMTNYQQATRS